MRPVPLAVVWLALPLALLLAPVAAADGPGAEREKPSCTANCHGEEAVALRSSVHRLVLACTDCHGGNAEAMRDKVLSHDAAKGFVGKPAREKIPALCGDCHSDAARMRPYGLPPDQLTLYKTSNHGKALFERGDTSVAVCTDCHGVHGILAHDDPQASVAPRNQPATCGRCHGDPKKMGPYGLPSDTSERFVRSVHGKALLVEQTRGAPSCADCHGSHGAVPPGVQDIVQVCANCHTNTGEEYRKSPHFASKEMACVACHAEEAKKDASYRRSGCTACHDDHEVVPPGDWMYQGNKVGTCDHCHRQADKAGPMKALVTAHRAKLHEAMRETERQIADAKARGLFLDAEKVYLRESERIFVSVRPILHSMDAAAIQKHLDGGVARQDRTREMIAKKGNVIRDHIIISSAVALLLLLMAALLGVKLEALRRLS